MYDAIDDPYCYRGTTVLKNRLGLRTQAALDAFEAEATAQRFDEAFPAGRFTVAHYKAVHRHIFGDVYPWAGRERRVRISKGGSMFCYPEHIPTALKRLFADLAKWRYLRGLAPEEFVVKGAAFLAELNAIHAFRDGNGRTQLAFFAILAASAGHPLNLDRLDPEAFLAAMIASFGGNETPLQAEIGCLVGLAPAPSL